MCSKTKTITLMGMYTAAIFLAGTLFALKVTPSEKQAATTPSAPKSEAQVQVAIKVEKKDKFDTEAPKNTLSSVFNLFSPAEKKISAKDVLTEYLARPDADFESWEFRRYLKELALEDWESAKQFIDQLPTQNIQNKSIDRILPDLARKDADLARRIAEESPNMTLKGKRLGVVCKAIAIENPAYVAEMFKANGMKNFGDYAINNLAADYSRHDLVEAKTFIDSIKDSVLKEAAFTQYMYVWSKDEPHAAAEFAINQKTTAGLSGPLWIIGQNLAEKDIDSALEFAMSQPVNENSAELLTGVYIRWARDDIHAASDAILRLPNSRIRIGCYEKLGQEFAKVDPHKGAEWIAKIKDNSYKKVATRNLVKNWVKTEPNATITYVNSLKSGRVKDSGIYPLIQQFQDGEPEYAIEWAAALNHQGGRRAWTKKVFSKWSKTDPEKAAIWLQQTNFVTEDQKKHLLK